MRLELGEFLKKLGVNHVLSPYETQPWYHYDDTLGITCSAEVRMGPGGDDIEIEMQFLKDDGEEDESDEETQDDTSGTDDGDQDGKDERKTPEEMKPGERWQILYMKAVPHSDTQWSPTTLTINNHNYVNDMHDWEGKGCAFFRACIQSIQMGELPDVIELEDKEMKDDSWGGGGGRGKIGRKSPKIKPAQLLGMKKGMGP